MLEEALTGVPIDQLEADIASLATELSRGLERWLAMVAEFDRRDGARRWGFRGTAEWLAWHCELSRRTARDHVRVARILAGRPVMREALATGELSYSKVRPCRARRRARVKRAWSTSRSSTTGEVERVVRALRSAPSADLDVAQAAHARRFLDWSWEPDGSLSVRGRLPAYDGAAFIEMIETGAAALHAMPAVPGALDSDADGEDAAAAARPERPPPLGARRADALAEIAQSGSPRAQVVLHVDGPALACTATEAEERDGATCRLEDGPAVPSETARRLSCDAELLVAREFEDGAVDYGRRRRVVPAPLRTVLERRDRHCRFPGCERRHDLHAHHVKHWAHGGATRKDNLVLLCRFHHRLVHEDGFSVRCGRDGTFDFRRPDRRLVPETPRHGRPATAPALARARGQPIAA